MEKAAHIITERQKRGALSSVKKQRLPKNVLVRNEIDFWPALNEEQNERFVKLLEVFCKLNIDLISLGLESTLRNLKKENVVQTLVIANEISPKFFGKHLIAMALHKNVSLQILIVPNLKNITKKLLKVPSIILTIRSSEKSSVFTEFYQSLSLHSDFLNYYYSIRPLVDVSIKKKRTKQISDEPPILLLRKPSDDSRSFIPMDAIESTQPDDKDDSPGFISLSKYSAPSLLNKPAPLYRPMKIAKIVGNSNRKQKKSLE